METTILIVFAVIGVIFIVACLIAPRMKKRANVFENTPSSNAPEKAKTTLSCKSASVNAIFVCEYKDGSIVLPEGDSFAFVRGNVSAKSPLKVYFSKTNDTANAVEIPVYRLKKSD